jgi:hypothetical protein
MNLPTNMFLSGRNYHGSRNIPTSNTSIKQCQINYTTKLTSSLKNGSKYDNQGMSEPNYNYTNWYPMHRPMKHYRKSGVTNTQMNYNSECCTGSYSIGNEYKLLGKNTEGINKILNSKNINDGCLIYDPTHSTNIDTTVNIIKSKGNVINSGSGMSNIKSGVCSISKKYYQNYSKYLYSRGNTYDQKLTFTKIPNIQYFNNNQIVYPVISQTTTEYDVPLNSSYYQGTSVLPDVGNTCDLVIYKPNNSQFAVQGAVDSSSRLSRLKYNTITTNNSSFYRQSNGYNNIKYSSDPVFFSKNKYTVPKTFNLHHKKTICTDKCNYFPFNTKLM